MEAKQLPLWSLKSDTCPFSDLIEVDDDHCFSDDKVGYECLAEDHPDWPKWVADVGGLGFSDIKARPGPDLQLPSFIPVVRRGSQKILKEIDYPFVGVSLGDIVTGKSLSTPDEVRGKFGISKSTKIVLLCFGYDNLIERIWTDKRVVLPKIAALNFDLVTGINYSVWLDQPHLERLFNLKRSLITFKEFQELGVPAIPHIYWFGQRDILRWCEWLSNNNNVKFVAIDLQTERKDRIWNQTLDDLKFFVSNLDRKIHFLIIGPSVTKRIEQLKTILPNFTLANSACSRKAASGYLIKEEGQVFKYEHSRAEKNKIMQFNIATYRNVVDTKFSHNFL